MMLTLDMSGDRPAVLVNGDSLQGVSRAEVIVTPDDVPVLIVRLVHFKLVGGTLPHGMFAKRNGEAKRSES
jgi:hypothetical protein